MIYTVICTDVNPYVNWQCELLEYTWKRAAQPGELIRLITCSATTQLPKQDHTRVIRIAGPSDRAGGYVAFERLFALQDWLGTEQPEGTVLIVDPDCVFRWAIPDEVEPGSPRAQHWLDFEATPPGQAATWPALIHTRDLENLLPRWIDTTRALWATTGRWESDMLGLVTAAASMGLRFSLDAIGAFVNWPDDLVEDAPIVHYCQDLVSVDGALVFSKRQYQPWDEIAATERARYGYCRDLLRLLNDCAADKRARTTNQA